jgi:hypothetical protein
MTLAVTAWQSAVTTGEIVRYLLVKVKQKYSSRMFMRPALRFWCMIQRLETICLVLENVPERGIYHKIFDEL